MDITSNHEEMDYRNVETLAAAGNVFIAAIASIMGQAMFGPDIVACVGAAVAAFISSVEAMKSKRDLWHTVMVFVSSVAVGWIMPGVIVWFWFPSHYATLPWQAWAGLGFVFGLLGWSITLGVLRLRTKIPDVIEKKGNQLLK